jgi:hypothetical protein
MPAFCFTVLRSPLFEIALVLVCFDHSARAVLPEPTEWQHIGNQTRPIKLLRARVPVWREFIVRADEKLTAFVEVRTRRTDTAPNVTTARNKSVHGGWPIVWLAAINQRMNLPLVFRLLLTRDRSGIGRVRQDPAPIGNKFFWVAKIGIDRLWIFRD